ncbi:MAG: EamA family transporter [Candidatus Altiarchaeota archaeon]
MTEIWAVATVLFAAFMGSFGSLQFKKGANKLELNLNSLMRNYDLMLGVVVYGLSTIFYVIGIKGGELTVLFPLVSTGYIWVCLLSIKYLGEQMNRVKWAGISCIVLGVILIGLGSGQ